MMEIGLFSLMFCFAAGEKEDTAMNEYAKHAAIWDWDGYDNSPEYDYWCSYAKQFGKKVLLPMCAIGQAGAYMAQHGLDVTAFDLTKEMIEQGKKRFGSIPNLSFENADICDLHLKDNNYDFCFIATQDLNLLADIDMVRKAFRSIALHLRKGACFALELVLPLHESFAYPSQTYYPRVPNYTDKKVWKEGKGRYDAVTKRQYIDQVIYIQDEKGIESIPHSIILQYFERDDILSALKDAGFHIAAEYKNREKDVWTPENQAWIVETIRN